MKQKLLLFLTILCVSIASAQTFAVDGINYTPIPNTTEVTVSIGSCYTGDLLLPSMVSDGGTNYTVTAIGDEAFRYCSGLTSISFPSTLTSIGGYSFAEAYDLTSLTMGVNVTSIGEYAFSDTSLSAVSLGSSVTSIGDGVFSGCRFLETVTNIDAVVSIGDHAFDSCTSLTSFTFPSSVTTVGSNLFEGCEALTSITIGTNMTEIGDSTFSNCTNLKAITIPSNITTIGDYAFSHSGLTSIIIPTSITSIGFSAFSNCVALKSVTIPNSVTSIGDFAFSRCSSLELFKSKIITPISIPQYTFNNTDIDACILVVSTASVTAYGNAAFWQDFTTITDVAPFTAAPSTTYATQVFAGDDKTIADLQLSGTDILWYDAATNGNLLATSKILVDNTKYYASQTLSGIESTERLAITVKRISDAKQFVVTGSTVADLTSSPSTTGKTLWHTAATGGTVLNNTDALTAATYYASQEYDKKFSGFSGAYYDLTIDNAGTIYVFTNSVIKKIALDDTVTILAGNEGVSASINGTGTGASFLNGSHLTMGSDGNLYVAEISSVKKVSLPDAVVTTLATGFSNFGGGITSDGIGNLYVANTDVSRVDKVSETTGVVTTVPNAADYRVRAVAIDRANNMLYTALYNLGSGYHYLKRVNLTDNSITTIGISGNGKIDGTATTAQFKNITDIAFNNASQTLYVVDDASIRQVDVALNVTTKALYAGTTKLAINETGTTFRATSSEVVQYNGLSNRAAVTVDFQPIVSTFLPANNATAVTISSDLKLTFNENIAKGTGNITIYNAADDSVFETIAVTASNVNVTGAVVTINPTLNLQKSKTYYVLVDGPAFKNGADNDFAGISNKTTWKFAAELKTAPTVTFVDFSKTYGDADFDLDANSNSTGTISYEIVAGGTSSVTLSGTNNATIALGNIGTVMVKATVAEDVNYNAASKTVALTIIKKAITVTADAKTKVYGTADVALTYSVVPSLETGDTFAGTLTRATGNNVGTYAISSSLNNTNYAITYVPADFNITAKSITVMADAKTKVYGTNDVALTYSVSPALVSGDSFTGALSRTPGNDVGTYAITSTLSNNNYGITFLPANYAITTKAITVTSDAKTKVYGTNDVALTYSVSPALVSGDSFTGALSRTPGNDVGTYAITSTLSNNNYGITFIPANYAITTKAITVTVDASQTKVYGTTDPIFGYSVSPALVSGDSFTGKLARASGNNVGTYVISQGTLSAGSNYTIALITKDFNITKANQTITWDQILELGCGAGNTAILTATSTSGLPISYTSSNSNMVTIVNGILTFTEFSSTNITAMQAGDGNYNAASVVTLPAIQSQPNLIRQQFDNVIFFDNSSNKFVAYKWYKNGNLVVGQTAQYFKENGSLNGTYYAIGTKIDGSVIISCSLVLSPSVEQDYLKISPNPVKSNSNYQLITNVELAKVQNARVMVYNMLGSLISDKIVNEKTVEMTAPSAEGIYIVKIIFTSGKSLTKNLLVRN